MDELRPQKHLLDPDFMGYKLSLDAVPVQGLGLHAAVDHVMPSDNQYSFLHIKVFSLHNHLYPDPWSCSVYYIDTTWRVQRCYTSKQTGCLEKPVEVWEMPSHHERRAGHYNTSVSFSSAEMAVLSDGTGTLHLVQTGSRSTCSLWQVLFSDEVCGKEKGFVIVHSRCIVTAASHREVHCILLHIDDTTRGDGDHKRLEMGSFMTTLEWIVLVEGGGGTWSVGCARQLSCHGDIKYAALELGCLALYVASDAPIRFVADSERPVEEEKPVLTAEAEAESATEYTWQQTCEDITVDFKLPEDASRTEVEVHVEKERLLRVAHKGHILLEGATWQPLDPHLTNWTLRQGKLQVNLTKAERGQMWQMFIPHDQRGLEVPDPAVVSKVHERLTHLCSDKEVCVCAVVVCCHSSVCARHCVGPSVQEEEKGSSPGFNSQQLEECDAAPSTTCVLVRLDVQTHKFSHQVKVMGSFFSMSFALAAVIQLLTVVSLECSNGCCKCPWGSKSPTLSQKTCRVTAAHSTVSHVQVNLGGLQWLFTLHQVADTVPAFCTRHDVDGCLWQPGTPTADSQQWPLEHTGTFPAFGYVQASKQQKKFSTCAPDMSYVAVCETSRRIYIYRQPQPYTGELRNRRTGQVVEQTAMQQVVNVDSSKEVLGIHASAESLYVLTSDTLFALRVNT